MEFWPPPLNLHMPTQFKSSTLSLSLNSHFILSSECLVYFQNEGLEGRVNEIFKVRYRSPCPRPSHLPPDLIFTLERGIHPDTPPHWQWDTPTVKVPGLMNSASWSRAGSKTIGRICWYNYTQLVSPLRRHAYRDKQTGKLRWHIVQTESNQETDDVHCDVTAAAAEVAGEDEADDEDGCSFDDDRPRSARTSVPCKQWLKI